MSDAPQGSTSTAPRLEMSGVSKRFGATVALGGVDLAVHSGQVMALVGENGAGKSTLMKILSGAYRPDSGAMQLDGQRYQPANPMEARRSGVAMIYQELSLAPHLTVEQNVMLGMEPSRFGVIDGRSVRAKAIDALRQLDHADIPPTARTGSISVAEQQLVEVARAVAIGCRVLVLDEPTSSLSQRDVKRLFALIDRLKRQGIAIVYISHFIEECQQVADQFTVLRDGVTVGSGRMDDASVDQIVAMMVGRRLDQLYPRSRRTPGEVVLEIDGLDGLSKPRGAALTLRRGEVVGIAGLVGAGRTELLRCVFGLDPVRRGTVRVVHVGGASASPAGRWRQGVGIVSEDRKAEGLAMKMSVADNLTLSRMDGFGAAGVVLPGRQNAATRRWIEALDIRCDDEQQCIAELSGGNQQKIAVARLLHHDVDVLLLDEPTRGIDVASKAQVYQLIDDLACGDEAAGRQPKAVLMISSYLPELLGVCDRIAVMRRGRLSEAKPVEQWSEHALLLEATAQRGDVDDAP